MTSDIRGKQGQRGKGWEESFGLGVHQSRVGDVRGPWAAFCMFTEIQDLHLGGKKDMSSRVRTVKIKMINEHGKKIKGNLSVGLCVSL